MEIIKFNGSITIFLVTLCIFIPNVLSCGMTTHNMVGRRAFNFSSFEGFEEYKVYISDNYPTFDAGCAFPDFGYSCGNLAEESEAAHWPPFLRAGTRYLLDTYNQPWSEDAIKLAVFLLGIASHQVADIPWHSIGGIKEGLIRAMAGQDFEGDYSVAHTNADDGGEFVLAYNYNLDWLSDEWYVPVTDIKNIFYLMNYTEVDDYKLVTCNSRLYAGAMGVKIGGKFLYPDIAKKSIFLIDHYQDYFNGGLDDMAIWTSYCWPVLMGWMQGQEIGNFCAIQPDPNNELVNDIRHYHGSSEVSHPYHDEIVQFINDNLEIKEQGNGYSIKLPKQMKSDLYDKLSSLYQEKRQIEKVKDKQQSALGIDVQIGFNLKPLDILENKSVPSPNYTSIQSENEYSYLGREIKSVDLNGDGLDDLVISSPGYGMPGAMQTGCVYYIFSGQNSSLSQSINSGAGGSLNINQLYNGKVCGNETHSRFGWTFEVLDFNLDGVLDLVIGAPGSENANLTYMGKVYVYFGEMSSGKWSVQSYPSMLIYGSNFHDQAGNLITSGDCNGDGHLDLILGTYTSEAGGTENGMVTLYYSSSKYQYGSSLDLNMEYDFQFYGIADYEWFGYQISVYHDIPENKSFILIGSPNYHAFNGTLMDVGKITAFPLNPPSWDAVFTLYGSDQFDKLGYNFQVVNSSQFGLEGKYDNLLLLSLPTKILSSDLDQAGQVLLIDLDSLIVQGDASKYLEISSSPSILSFQGTTKYSRFGECLLLGKIQSTDSNPTLFIGAPLWTDSYDDTGPGIVFSFDPMDYLVNDKTKSPNLISKENSKFYKLSSSSSGTTVQNNIKDSRFGFRMVLADLNMDGTNDLIIGAARDSSELLEGGSVNIFLSS
ncbi:glycosylphosphatidylinositol phospholipase D [Tieghemostelium lacteum]|uniref:Phosphatidylinositol-glycan-specific phospholipase D n=1 Tax=Tieghemostelium lacteum TaxID=361077 RepID=A0A151ZKG5_TIELA|nr:glycosylphosphatidylinositol phospholipase D [Tieghemostelium lacteum]|eukprot:KYQ94491.1 glycosylphosphatidylinositol phospholipase D [Tieghemostelium lacteum]